MEMKWLSIKEHGIPEGEVLAGNFTPGSYGYKEKLVGYIIENKDGSIVCDSEETQLQGVTHFIYIHQHDPS